MKTTQTRSNVLKAQRLLQVRAQLKLLQVEEKALKAHFSNLIESEEGKIDVKNLELATVITIIKAQVTRSSYDAKHLDFYFDNNDIEKSQFKKFSSYHTIKAV